MSSNFAFENDATVRANLNFMDLLSRISSQRWAARMIHVLATVVALIAISQTAHGAGTAGQVVFHLDKHYRPVVRLDRVPQSEAVKAILAMYALQNGAGCQGKNESGLVVCSLTSALGLGANCSHEHLELVHKWFTKTPNLTSRWNERRDVDARNPGSLEELCYKQPDTASWHNSWEIIRVDVRSNVVVVDAVFFGGSQHGSTRARYISSYQVGKSEIVELRSDSRVLERSSKSIFEGQ